jgi:excisionase family DNA binding protein
MVAFVAFNETMPAAMNTTHTRLDPSLLSKKDRADLPRLVEFAEAHGRPCLRSADGQEMRLPPAMYEVLVHVAREMSQGRAIVLMPEDEDLTTQAAADFLGMSRQYLVRLLDEKKLPSHKVGTHRRVRLKDLRAYAAIRNKDRRAILDGLFDEAKAAGLYD